MKKPTRLGYRIKGRFPRRAEQLLYGPDDHANTARRQNIRASGTRLTRGSVVETNHRPLHTRDHVLPGRRFSGAFRVVVRRGCTALPSQKATV